MPAYYFLTSKLYCKIQKLNVQAVNELKMSKLWMNTIGILWKTTMICVMISAWKLHNLHHWQDNVKMHIISSAYTYPPQTLIRGYNNLGRERGQNSQHDCHSNTTETLPLVLLLWYPILYEGQVFHCPAVTIYIYFTTTIQSS